MTTGAGWLSRPAASVQGPHETSRLPHITQQAALAPKTLGFMRFSTFIAYLAVGNRNLLLFRYIFWVGQGGAGEGPVLSLRGPNGHPSLGSLSTTLPLVRHGFSFSGNVRRRRGSRPSLVQCGVSSRGSHLIERQARPEWAHFALQVDENSCSIDRTAAFPAPPHHFPLFLAAPFLVQIELPNCPLARAPGLKNTSRHCAIGLVE